MALEDALNGLADYGPRRLAPAARSMALRARRRADEASEDEEERVCLARGTLTG